MVVIGGQRHKLGQTFTEPHGDVSLHVDGERFESLLQAADGEVAQAADVLTKIDPPDLRQAQSAHRDET